MDEIEDFRDISSDLIAFAQSRGVELEAFRGASGFLNDGRFITCWRQDGILNYSLQGEVSVLPQEFKESASEFHGVYIEAGVIDSLEQAVQLFAAWLIHRCNADELPKRRIKKRGIG